MKKWFLNSLMGILILLDLSYSFYQYNNAPLQGDLSEVVYPFPSKGYYHVLKDPFAFHVITENKIYPNPNRFFAHYSASLYFKNVPFILQKAVKPIDSVYLSAAIAKLLTHLLLLLLIARFVSSTWRFWEREFLLAMLLVTPLFQAAGYNRFMGIIDQSVIYVFFYALPLAFFLIFLLPLYRYYYEGVKAKINVFVIIVLFSMCPFLVLNGPLITGIVLIGFPMLLVVQFLKMTKKNTIELSFWQHVILYLKRDSIYIILLCVFCFGSLFSLYVGKNNSLNFGETIPVFERYMRIPEGLYFLITTKIGFPILFGIIALNCFVLNKYFQNSQVKKMFHLFKWIGVFSILYILLLPLGGFRSYRANIIRYDTFLPITFALFFIFAATSVFILKLRFKSKIGYIILLGLIISIFSISDRNPVVGNECEYAIISAMSESKDAVFKIESDCKVMCWETYKVPSESLQNATLLHYWGITDKIRYYYNVP